MPELVTLEGERRRDFIHPIILRVRKRRAARLARLRKYMQTRSKARIYGRRAFLSADQNPELGSFLSRTFRKAKNLALKVSRIALGPIDTVIAKALEVKINQDGGVIKPGLRSWAINNSNTLLASAGPQASLARPILPKLIDRALVRLRRKYKSEDDSFEMPAGIDKKYLIGGGALLLLVLVLMMRKKERVEIRTRG